MGWYNWFSHMYDSSMEKLYREQRQIAASKLGLAPGQVVLDCPVGTGLSLDELAPAVGPTGTVLGMDLSKGMLKKARRRCALRGWDNVTLVEGDVREATSALPEEAEIDRLYIFLGLSAFPDWEVAFESLWARLKPGGRCVVVDVHAAEPSFQGKMVNLVARADIRRETWVPLERCASNFTKEPLPTLKQHGGELYVAVGDKP